MLGGDGLGIWLDGLAKSYTSSWRAQFETTKNFDPTF